ncbi:MAG: aminodeoxychorismate synthase component I [Gammaproteobacteria bacterium]|nr:aminodeoxychorismate synthase component I [Gammaproteobacteria bacterium]NNC97365.1 aminodeoxychorismate synthase component I [Gammaproteobacteria bacterium]NNM13116.1 aminodeoxychorismate synthase component I [Gammaproteobacteria bacterium]
MLHRFEHELDLIELQHTDTNIFPYLLDSAAHGSCYARDEQSPTGFRKQSTSLGRYSILFAYPQKILTLGSDNKLSYDKPLEHASNDFLDAFDKIWEEQHKTINNEHKLPFLGGWFLYLAYELAQQIEPSVEFHSQQYQVNGLPIAFACRIPVAVIVDHVEKTSYLVAEVGFQTEFKQLLQMLKGQENLDVSNPSTYINSVSILKVEDPDIYRASIQKTREYIYAGDIFQANLSRAWHGEISKPLDSANLYRKLRESNPGPFAGLMYHNNAIVMSSSPERLLKVDNDKASTRPIAGTRPRTQLLNEDELMRRELFKHPKERAEHVMLIDLERNDLGRICEPGSIEVDELMVIESYEHVHHIVSNVSGNLKPNVSPGQALKAVFPGGTITGCPKVRCMEIISELEKKPREAYTGSMGYVNHNGNMDMNILIRTIQIQADQISFRAGGGIVYDSDPDNEVLETRAKAKGMLQALNEFSQ